MEMIHDEEDKEADGKAEDDGEEEEELVEGGRPGGVRRLCLLVRVEAVVDVKLNQVTSISSSTSRLSLMVCSWVSSMACLAVRTSSALRYLGWAPTPHLLCTAGWKLLRSNGGSSTADLFGAIWSQTGKFPD